MKCATLTAEIMKRVSPAPAATCAATATPAPVNKYVAPAPTVICAVTAPVTDNVTPAAADACAAPATVTYHVALAPAGCNATPATVNAHVTPAPVTEYIAPSSAATRFTLSLDHKFREPAILYPCCGGLYVTSRWLFSFRGRVCFARVQPCQSGTDRCRARER